MTPATQIQAPDLTQQYPASPNALLGEFILLPRILDKCRAVIAGTAGEYDSGCGLDMMFFNHFNVDYEAFKAEVAKGKNNEEMLTWVKSQLDSNYDETAILAWSYEARTTRPESPEKKAFLESYRRKTAPNVRGIETFFDMLDAEEGRLQ